MADPHKFRGFRSPNYTQVPDELFDELLATLTGAELKVLLYIIRRTFGFKKTSDNISLSQITDGIVTASGKRMDSGTGLVKSTAALALKGLIAKNIILKVRNQTPGRGDMATTYALNVLNEAVQKLRPPVSENQTPREQKIGHPEARKSDTQETVRQEKVYINVNVDQYSRNRSDRSASAVSEQALINHYGFNQQEVDETQALVALQLDVLGAGERNLAAYVKRAAEAVRDKTQHILRLALGDVKDTAHRKPIISLPAYFTRVYDAMRADAQRLQPETLPTHQPTYRPSSDDDFRDTHRDRLLESMAAKGYRVPMHLRTASLSDVAAWCDQVEHTHPTASFRSPPPSAD